MEQLKFLAQKIALSPLYIKYNRLIIPGIVLVIAILILSLVTVPQFFKLLETFKTINELNTKKDFYKNKIGELQSLDVPKYKQNLETALIALPVDRDIPGLTGQLLSALNGSGMSLGGISFSSGSPESEKVQEYTLTIDVTGSDESLENFLERIKLAPRIIRLNAITISKGKAQTISASLGFVTLYQQLPQHIGSVDEKMPQITTKDFQTLADIQAKLKSLPQEEQISSSSATGKLDPFSK